MRLYWIKTPIGRLATAPAPSGSALDREVKDLLQEKVSNVISLLTDQEVTSIGLLAEHKPALGIDNVYFFKRTPL